MDLENTQATFFPDRLMGSTKVLLHKVFFDLLFYTGRLGKEALPSLYHDSFTMKCSLKAKTFVEIVFNEANKKFKSAIHLLPMTPVSSFEHYLYIIFFLSLVVSFDANGRNN